MYCIITSLCCTNQQGELSSYYNFPVHFHWPESSRPLLKTNLNWVCICLILLIYSEQRPEERKKKNSLFRACSAMLNFNVYIFSVSLHQLSRLHPLPVRKSNNKDASLPPWYTVTCVRVFFMAAANLQGTTDELSANMWLSTYQCGQTWLAATHKSTNVDFVVYAFHLLHYSNQADVLKCVWGGVQLYSRWN